MKISILRGNLSEISFIAGLKSNTKGVDASEADSLNDAESIAKNVAEKYNCAVAITGKIDVLSDSCRVFKIANGHPALANVTGTGCMSTAIIGAYASVTDDMLLAAVSGVSTMGIAGEIAYEKAKNLGTGNFHIALIDAISNLNSSMILERAKIQ